MPDPFTFPDDFALAPTAINGTKTLDGRIYRFRFLPSRRANDGRGAWYVDLFNVLGQPSVLLVKVVLTDDLFGSYRTTDADVPPGRVVVRRTDNVDEDPRPPNRAEVESKTLVATLGSPLLVVEYVPVAEDNGVT